MCLCFAVVFDFQFVVFDNLNEPSVFSLLRLLFFSRSFFFLLYLLSFCLLSFFIFLFFMSRSKAQLLFFGPSWLRFVDVGAVLFRVSSGQLTNQGIGLFAPSVLRLAKLIPGQRHAVPSPGPSASGTVFTVSGGTGSTVCSSW